MAAASRAARPLASRLRQETFRWSTPADKPGPMAIWSIPNGQGEGEGGKAFVDFQNDVTASDIKLAVREGYHSVEHVKRYTTTGTLATDQGKTSNINALAILAEQLGEAIPEVEHNHFPYALYADLYGDDRGPRHRRAV